MDNISQQKQFLVQLLQFTFNNNNYRSYQNFNHPLLNSKYVLRTCSDNGPPSLRFQPPKCQSWNHDIVVMIFSCHQKINKLVSAGTAESAIKSAKPTTQYQGGKFQMSYFFLSATAAITLRKCNQTNKYQLSWFLLLVQLKQKLNECEF